MREIEPVRDTLKRKREKEYRAPDDWIDRKIDS